MLDDAALTNDASSIEALFKEARQRRRKRRRTGVAIAIASALAIAGVLYGVDASRGGSGGGLASGSEPGPSAPSGPEFNQPNDIPSSWVRTTYRADGLLVTLAHPPSWTPRLPAQGFHYADTWSFVANFPLNRNWCVHGTSSLTCIGKNLGTFPPKGLLMTLGTGGYEPAFNAESQGLGPGTRITINGRDARLTLADAQMLQAQGGGLCLGVGATGALGVRVDDGARQGEFDLSFCFSGPNEKALEDQARVVVATLHIRSDPSAPSLL
jgi:hypothetical protein